MPSKLDLVLGAAALCLLGGMAVPAGAAETAPSVGVSIDWQALEALPKVPGPAAFALKPPPQPKPAPAPRPVGASLQSPPAPAPPPAPPSAKLASLPAPAAPALKPGRIGVVAFQKGQVEVPSDEVELLDSIAQKLASDSNARLTLIAHASGNGDDAADARRISLTRAVQLRTYLMQKGVPSVRMDVRALGNKDLGSGPADRVDLVIVER